MTRPVPETLPAPPVYRWAWQRGEPAGLLLPVYDTEGDLIDVADPGPWPTTARVHPEPGDDRVLFEFLGDTAIEHARAGVHLHATAEQTRAAAWRRGWLEVLLTDPRAPTEVAVIARVALTIT